jgi:hypothetical protein
MGTFFDIFPKRPYDINREQYSNYVLTTDILFRLSFIKNVLENSTSYYEYTLTDEDRPEILAEKLYGNPEAHWIILLANDMIDPQYDWPLDYRSFLNYVTSKYGSVANAQTTIHHYEKKVINRDINTGKETTATYVIDYNTKTDGFLTLTEVLGTFSAGEAVYQGTSLAESTFSANVVTWSSGNGSLRLANSAGQVLRFNTIYGDNSDANGTVQTIDTPMFPFSYYLSLVDEPTSDTYNVANSQVVQTVERNSVTNFDYEFELNESKRSIKLIKKDYYPQIMREFENLTNTERSIFLRGFS